MNIVYFGSPDFSAQILETVRANVIAVVTTPDQPVGRHKVMTPSPVAQLATKLHLPVFKPEKLNGSNLAHIKLLKPDIFLVVSYGKIIPKSWLDTPTIGAFNIHFSLLPKYRGALPISEAIKNQDRETGVTLMVMDEKLDHGPIISQKKVSIDINDNCGDLTKKLTQAAIQLLEEYLPKLPTTSSPQNDSLATYTPSVKSRTRQSAFISWETIKNAMTAGSWQLAADLHALIRSLNPDPGAWTKINSLEIKILKTTLVPPSKVEGGQGGVSLHLDSIQLPGKSPISWKQFQAGHQIT